MVAKNVLEPSASPAFDSSIMELSLMLPRRQFDALEQRAHDDGISVGQFLRRIVQDSITEQVLIGDRE